MSLPRYDDTEGAAHSEASGHDVEHKVEGKSRGQAPPAGQGGPSNDDLAAGKDETIDSSMQEVQQEAQQEAQQEDEVPYPEPRDDEPLLPPPDFRPFFTLIEDDNGEHHHPTVHYVFADDEDTDILTNAALQTLNDPEQPPQDGIPDDRFVVLDLDPTGKDVVSTVSLSPEWQNLKTNISPAPSWGGGDENRADRGLMLRISGQEARKEAAARKHKAKGNIDALLKEFDENLSGLNGVLRSGDKDTHDTVHEGREGAAA